MCNNFLISWHVLNISSECSKNVLQGHKRFPQANPVFPNLIITNWKNKVQKPFSYEWVYFDELWPLYLIAEWLHLGSWYLVYTIQILYPLNQGQKFRNLFAEVFTGIILEAKIWQISQISLLSFIMYALIQSQGILKIQAVYQLMYVVFLVHVCTYGKV